MTEQERSEEDIATPAVPPAEAPAERPRTFAPPSAPSGERGPGPAGGRPPRRSGGGFGGGGFGGRRRKVCIFCVDHIEFIDYKEVGRLRRYISERGKIEPRRKTGTCAKHQRSLSNALKRARHIALLPYTAGHIRATGATFGPQR